ncbi:rCG37771 [Rattus norvegicus]|uniref:RCG37771 n=1 Tax=Rattus norvegicus TaxID=10116 RepID=A6JF22_RAT|nr:rCG37771 [Rattus norvegicus]
MSSLETTRPASYKLLKSLLFEARTVEGHLQSCLKLCRAAYSHCQQCSGYAGSFHSFFSLYQDVELLAPPAPCFLP